MLTKYEKERIRRIKENEAVYKSLGLPSLVASVKQAGVQSSTGKSKEVEESDHYLPSNDDEDDTDDSSEVHQYIFCLCLIILVICT